MRKHLLTALVLAFSNAAFADRAVIAKPSDPTAARHVDLVIALDTSGSMDGLIDSARQKLWDIVNLLGHAKPMPTLRVGLISYGGTDGYDPARGWVRTESDLTTDLDSIYAKLFALHTSGGDEYVARAVHVASTEMSWSKEANALKIVFVAGNEPATQDPRIPVTEAISEARNHNIFVNTIYCGSETAEEAHGWRQAAALGHGQYASIDQNHVAVISTPMDAELGQLSQKLNQTYIAYGALGAEKSANQAAQDRNAIASGPAAAPARAEAKASSLYRADDWDLVDAKKSGKKIAEMTPAQLPEPMRHMKPEEREAFVGKKAKEREAIQKRIAELSQKRDAFIKTERANKAVSGQKGLDDALSESIRGEAKSAGFSF